MVKGVLRGPWTYYQTWENSEMEKSFLSVPYLKEQNFDQKTSTKGMERSLLEQSSGPSSSSTRKPNSSHVYNGWAFGPDPWGERWPRVKNKKQYWSSPRPWNPPSPPPGAALKHRVQKRDLHKQLHPLRHHSKYLQHRIWWCWGENTIAHWFQGIEIAPPEGPAEAGSSIPAPLVPKSAGLVTTPIDIHPVSLSEFKVPCHCRAGCHELAVAHHGLCHSWRWCRAMLLQPVLGRQRDGAWQLASVCTQPRPSWSTSAEALTHSLLLRSWWGFLAPAPVALPFQWKDYTSTFRKKFLYQYILLLLLCHKNNEMLQMTSLCLKNLEFG